ncbi:hypothetical protein EDF46_2494 [Frondihabitans sp. PhB188]|uniref:T6SS immunity protein Tdi1 domain-containing protein n=1 Tax=Frondihabitans sp. PhB188 TaxID=2485200 RepID=UPI000F467526|nr:T6SS immunity protein Tdi1 domain-containing protein [Frondihabitans sp. PhB188]ROQ37050.1 hypothetical protein EDF46_2494 [Frondihabitans sp. PhB188]
MFGRKKQVDSPFEGFVKTGSVPKAVIEGFSSRVPPEVVALWQAGTGTLADGLIRVVDPYDCSVVISSSYTGIATAVPIFQSAFGDVIIWDTAEQSFGLLNFRQGTHELVSSKFSLLPRWLADETFLDTRLDQPLYRDAVAKLAPVDADTIFGHVPLLALGGPKDVQHLDRVKTREHLMIITHMMGPLS